MKNIIFNKKKLQQFQVTQLPENKRQENLLQKLDSYLGIHDKKHKESKIEKECIEDGLIYWQFLEVPKM